MTSGNRILDALLAEDARLHEQCERVELAAGEEIYASNAPIRHVYFPTSGALALLVRMSGGQASEGALIGREGFTGIAPVLGLEHSIHTIVQQLPGPSLRLSVAAVTAAVRAQPRFASLALRYAAYGLYVACQAGACNQQHSVPQRTSRWLLMLADRADDERLALTQEMLAGSVGAGRQTLSEVASALKRARLIAYSRGRITLLDRTGLEAQACECYGLMREAYGRIMG